MTLFDDIPRSNRSRAPHGEPMFRFLNRMDGVVWARVRTLLETWWREHPVTAQKKVRGEIRKSDDHAFLAAIFELYGHQVLRRVYDTVIEHPVTSANRPPDFLATSACSAPLVVEMTSIGASPAAKARARRRSTIYNQMNSWSLPDFRLRVKVLDEGPGNPSLRRLRRELEAWIGSLDVNEIAALAAEPGVYLASELAPRYTWVEAGWSIEFGVIPRAPDQRAPTDQAIWLYGAEAGWVDVDPIRRRLADKASAYGEFDGPYVVAVLLNGLGADDDSVAAALYGDVSLTLPSGDVEAGQLGRRPNGSWFKTDGLAPHQRLRGPHRVPTLAVDSWQRCAHFLASSSCAVPHRRGRAALPTGHTQPGDEAY